MLYVLFGEDTYRSRKKLREIIDRFYAVAGGRESAVRIVLPEHSRQEVEQVLTTGSLFRDKRLFVVEDPSGATADVAAYLEEQLPTLTKSDDIYVVWDRVPVSAAIVARAAKTQEFRGLTPESAARFLDEEARMRGVSLNANEKRRILADTSGDSWHMVEQLEKSALMKGYDDKGIPNATRVDTQADRAIFSLLDAYGLSQRAKAWHIYTMLVQAGMGPEKIFWRLLSHTKTLLSIHSLIQRGVAMADIPRVAGVHPFVAKKAAAVVAHIPAQNLTLRHTSLVALDFQTKQSRGDLALGLERILLSM
ncbi:MAG: hypothetical protein A3J55_03320 [Candidatus Ryanbacteria bacterium RIFCSPHIGHO2_02_FULL_45_17b]|uniref:DNA-directed DNA polymerase n=1 Tax=Candidatus Ryanbacteria bacterium RIFCSPHIGHO2_01_FULL_45_22 TaxID=1802114 RepID=A0A1G2G316_9BACT|nr:MAG: hypothetical protein A2719_04520 [Candidatus Ryanbacteria bacterium RIFCSPHIGHO2_01_FULL_45_22]OGZ47492.1 MAG: hypothetical protein A3J55_03320 [Candidatus Ryanbacteria bacterium RIFCSPHIGHO2_02_FULL_45_17b]